MLRHVLIGGTALVGLALSTIADEPAKPDPSPTPSSAATEISLDEVLRSRRGSGDGHNPAPGKYRDFDEVTKGADKVEGLFTLYQKDDHLYAELRSNQFDQPFLVPTTVAKGAAQAGLALNSDDEMVIMFRRSDDRVHLVRRNIHYKAPSGTPLEKSVKQNYTDSILLSLPIVTVNPAGSAPLIDFSDIFLTDISQLGRSGMGGLDRSRSSWHRVKGFPNNMELEVEATFQGGGRGYRGDDGVADPRGVTVVIHYSLIRLPDGGYRPRVADDRVGYFLSASKDFGVSDPDSSFVRYINRWRLEKADPKAKLSPPKKQIVWYIEDTVPFEYRPYVESGIREWNKAFEKIGYRDAIAVRWQEPGRDDFDPEDTNYCTFRWITTDTGLARSNLRANPLTGEMLDGDVVFHGGFVQHWKREYARVVAVAPNASGDAPTRVDVLGTGQIISPMLAAKSGFGQPGVGLRGFEGMDRASGQPLPAIDVIPNSWGACSGNWPGSWRPDRAAIASSAWAFSATSACCRWRWPTRRSRTGRPCCPRSSSVRRSRKR